MLDDNSIQIAYFSPETQKVVVLDMVDGTNFHLSLVDPETKNISKIDRLYALPDGLMLLSMGNSIQFSADGQLVLYTTRENVANYTTYVKNTLGNQPIKISSNRLLGSRFSPDSQSIAYIQFPENSVDFDGNNLTISTNQGESSVVLDRNVSSFVFTPDSREIYYFSVDTLGDDEYLSYLYRIRVDGTHREQIMGPLDGLYLFLQT